MVSVYMASSGPYVGQLGSGCTMECKDGKRIMKCGEKKATSSAMGRCTLSCPAEAATEKVIGNCASWSAPITSPTPAAKTEKVETPSTTGNVTINGKKYNCTPVQESDSSCGSVQYEDNPARGYQNCASGKRVVSKCDLVQ